MAGIFDEGASTQSDSDAKRSFGMELRSLGLSYDMTGDKKYLKSMMTLLKSGAEDNEHAAKMVENLALCRLICDKGTPVDEACCKSALQEIMSMWPNAAARVTEKQLMAIARGLRHAQIALPYRNIRLFLVETSRSLEHRQLPLDDDDAAAIAEAAVKYIDLLVGRAAPPVADDDLPGSAFADCLDAQARQLDRIADLCQIKVSRLSQLGADAVEYTLPEIWANFGNNLDKDSAKHMAAHLHRWSSRAIAKIFTEIEEMMRAMVVSQKALVADLREAEDAAKTELAMETDDAMGTG
ncbi:hypothetical protein LTR35_013283 [Friedmanniomyces endolithicus]|uniref:Uncharacterized protein n=1 Tax=Friedmanniomyces endolithicus TaxID=329885 RepID=A0AAN6FEU1_9PEZI|nr:hypothetical protein LTR35_013283 [Friedmanniomyces endolithicus]KAK0289282.1 hypothetical protein LTS00_009201 [Friedmanniomyces endolithicus]KAK0315280.1 hypothetical protein LTR82_012607 [Friedmanniomyces endolithicus]KAK0988160.1 hypothetical protein LTR54_012868 [Friedmanniomyces endolithicus]KAK1066457.1 hypothetical protein LTR74_007179 [Friedmanniomyces endolithicus]